MKNAKNDERNCPTKDESFKLNEYAFTDSASTEGTCWKLTQDKKCSAGACPCFLSPKKVVRRLKFISSALLLSSLRYRFGIAFLGLFLIAFLQRQGFILADKRTKVEKTFSSVQVLRPGFASQVTHERPASAWSQRHYTLFA